MINYKWHLTYAFHFLSKWNSRIERRGNFCWSPSSLVELVYFLHENSTLKVHTNLPQKCWPLYLPQSPWCAVISLQARPLFVLTGMSCNIKWCQQHYTVVLKINNLWTINMDLENSTIHELFIMQAFLADNIFQPIPFAIACPDY